MAIPDFFHRNAVAIAQVISGLDDELLENILHKVCVGVAIGSDATRAEGRATLDLLVRLFSRLYPAMSFRDESESGIDREAADLAMQVNPRIDLSMKPTVEVCIGSVRGEQIAHRTLFVGCDGWNAKLSLRTPQTCGDSNNPFGAGLTACLAAADVFRHIFKSDSQLEDDLELSIPRACVYTNDSTEVNCDVGNLVLAGAGAIGNATAWALSRSQVRGTIDIVDDESIDLGNLQRYVLARRADENKPKAEFVAEHFNKQLQANAYRGNLGEFLEMRNSRTSVLLLALDSANDRRAAQASLPRRIANAWTQPNDLGLSIHNFIKGACVNCLYLPDGQQTSDDVLIAELLGVMDRLQEVRTLLHKNAGTPKSFLEAVALARNIPLEKLLPFEGRPLRQLYSEGFCGGAVIPLKDLDAPAVDVHVPLAHQSAIAGLLLAAAAIRLGSEEPDDSIVAQMDVLQPQKQFQTYTVLKDARGRCICQDEDYISVYRQKYVEEK